MGKYKIYKSNEYEEWFENERPKSQTQIKDRLVKIEEDEYFGHHKYLDSEDIWELKFNDGRRIYYVIVPETKVLLLLGGNKNGQGKDIKQASNILRKIIENES